MVEDKKSTRGRVVAKRKHGKITFLDIDSDGQRTQCVISRDNFRDNYAAARKDLSIGNIVYVEGSPFNTSTGVPTIRVETYNILTKCESPEKIRIRPNEEYRRRNRGIDLLTSVDSREKFKQASGIYSQIRSFLSGSGFLEVDTGTLRDTTDTSKAREFITHLNADGRELYLRKSTEQRLKQLLVGGLENIFELGKVFRNEGLSKNFLPEFTVLELYQSYGNYRTLLDLTTNMLKSIEANVGGLPKSIGNFKEVDFYDFLNENADSDVRGESVQELSQRVPERKRKDYPQDESSRGYILADLFESFMTKEVEGNIAIIGYPKEISVLAKTKDSDSSLAEEFRLFVDGVSFCYGSTELNNLEEQSRRIADQAKFWKKPVDKLDPKFEELLKIGLPPCAGLGLSVERLASLYLGRPNLRDIVLFPL